jgi:hypothetical protein
MIPLAVAIVATIAVNVVNIAIDKLLEEADPRKLGVLAHSLYALRVNILVLH